MWRLAAITLIACAVRAQSVVGTLTDSIRHTPIPDVIVTLLGPTRYNATTDDAGAFHFDLIQPGKYVLNIVKAGYLLRPERRDFQVGSEAVRLSVEMDPLGRIEGRVTYPDGRPARHAPVSTGNFKSETDADGRFFFEDVKPGAYVVRASGGPQDPLPDEGAWVPTSGEPLHVTIGSVVNESLRLRSAPVRLLHGIVRDEGGQPVAGATVKLAAEQTTTTAADGSFDFITRDGDWRVTATSKAGAVERRGVANIPVVRHDIENAEIRLALPFSLPIEIDRGDTPSDPRRPLMLILVPQDGPSPGVFMTSTSQHSIDNVYPGRHSLQAHSTTPGEYVESVKLGPAEVYGQYFALWDGTAPLRIKFGKGAASIHASIETGDAAVCLLFNADEAMQTDRVQGYTGISGKRIDITGLRPGDYYLFAFDRNDPLRFTPAFLTTLLSQAVKVHLAKGDNLNVPLKLTPLPQ